MSILPASEQADGRTSNLGPAEKAMDSLVREGYMTTEGRDAMITELDPFHDLARQIEVVPDFESCNSIVQHVKRQMTITKPQLTDNGSPFPAGNWDCHIYSTPYEVTEPCYQFESSGSNYRLFTPISTGNIGTIMVCCAPTGEPTAASSQVLPDPSRTRTFAMSAVEFDKFYHTTSNFVQGWHRNVAFGFEVINVTEPFYKKGTCTVYRQNQQHTRTTGTQVDAAYLPVGIQGTVVLTRGPPNNVADALLLPGSRQWTAAEGSYSVGLREGQALPFHTAIPQMVLLLGGDPPVGDYSDTPDRLNYCLAGFKLAGPGVSAARQQIARGNQRFSTVGAYYTGLNDQTTFTLNARFINDRAPTLTESDLIPLVQPSPPFDETAFRIYSIAASRMEPGVRLKDNAMGDFFRKTVSDVSKGLKASAPVLRQVAAMHPHGRMALQIADTASAAHKHAKAHGKGGGAKKQGKKKKK